MLFPWVQVKHTCMLSGYPRTGCIYDRSLSSFPLYSSLISTMFFNGFKLFDRLAIMMLAMMNQQNIDLPSSPSNGLVRGPSKPAVASRPPPPVAMRNQSLPFQSDHNRSTSNHTIRKPAGISPTEGQPPSPNGGGKQSKKPAATTTITPAINQIDSSGKSGNTSQVMTSKAEKTAGKVGQIRVQVLTEKAVNSSNR